MKNTKAKILVTGATGTVGSELVKKLSEMKVPVRAAVHTKAKADKIKLPGVELVELDYDDPKSIDAAFKGIEKLYLLTPFSPNAVEITSMIVNTAKAAGVKHIVRMSAFGSDQNTDSILLNWHKEAENVVKSSGLAWTIIRPAVFMQNFANFGVESIKQQNTLYAPAGDAKLNFIDVRDIAAVAAKVLTTPGHEAKEYNITGPEALTHKQVADILSKVTGKEINYVSTTDEQTRQGMKQMGMLDWMIDGMLGLYKVFMSGISSKVTDTVEKVAGKKPITFEQFAKDYANAFK